MTSTAVLERSVSTDRVQEMFRKLMAFDITEVKRLLVERDHIPREHVEEMERQYKQYLSLVACNPTMNLPISTEVDKMWHAHLLTTLSYHKMCDEIIGKFLHHVPALDESHFERLVLNYQDNTVPMMKREFGTVNERFWPAKASICQGPYVCQ